jgi:uncharacterized membrane protein YhfC
MLEGMYIIGFTGMVLLPIAVWILFTRKFNLSWKLVLAGGLTFVASQILHIPLVVALGPWMSGNTLLVNAIVLGLLAGIFEETARYILFKFILKNTRTWQAAILVGLGHGGTEALLLGIAAGAAFFTMLAYRTIDLSTVPSIPPEQLELAKQQVAAYWAAPAYMPLLGFAERIFAMSLHVCLSVMVLLAITARKPIWFWAALAWHALVDAVAVYSIQYISALGVEGLIAIFASLSITLVFLLRPMFTTDSAVSPTDEMATA